MNTPINIKDADFEDVVLKSHLPVVVEFWSPGCGPCEMYVPVFEELASRFAGKLLIAKYNVDENFLKVAKQYGVLGAPTILFMKKGEIVHRTNGYLSIAILKKEVAKFIGESSSKKEHLNQMFKNLKFPYVQPNRFLMMIVISSLAIFAIACASTAGSTANPVNSSGGAAASSAKVDACILLTKDDVSKALGVTVDTIESKGLGGVCSYKTKNLSIDLTVLHTGGIKYLNDTIAKIGDLALQVPGLGDQAFYNTNSIVNALFVRKGDAAYLISVNASGQTLTPPDVQAKEKALAVQLLSHLS
jgi:thioredoxin 1